MIAIFYSETTLIAKFVVYIMSENILDLGRLWNFILFFVLFLYFVISISKTDLGYFSNNDKTRRTFYDKFIVLVYFKMHRYHQLLHVTNMDRIVAHDIYLWDLGLLNPNDLSATHHRTSDVIKETSLPRSHAFLYWSFSIICTFLDHLYYVITHDYKIFVIKSGLVSKTFPVWIMKFQVESKNYIVYRFKIST